MEVILEIPDSNTKNTFDVTISSKASFFVETSFLIEIGNLKMSAQTAMKAMPVTRVSNKYAEVQV